MNYKLLLIASCRHQLRLHQWDLYRARKALETVQWATKAVDCQRLQTERTVALAENASPVPLDGLHPAMARLQQRTQKVRGSHAQTMVAKLTVWRLEKECNQLLSLYAQLMSL